MVAETCELAMPGAMLKRGFWLYVWRIETPKGTMLYVGRTGDSSSPRANPPYMRMGQHLGRNKNQNALRRQLEGKGVKPEACASFELIAHGPLFPEQADSIKHEKPRDIMAALEKRLRDCLCESGYQVLNVVRSRKKLDKKRWLDVHAAFAKHFPKMKGAEDE